MQCNQIINNNNNNNSDSKDNITKMNDRRAINAGNIYNDASLCDAFAKRAHI